MVDFFGEDVGRIVPFLELLKASIGNRETIDKESLEPFLASPGDVAPWDLTDAIESGQVERSLELLRRMIDAGGKHPLLVLSVLQRRFTDLAAISSNDIRTPQQVRETLKARYKSFNRPDFVLDKMLGIARKIGYHRLSRSFELLSMADRQIKGEGGLSPDLAIELLIGKLAHLMRSV
jgi:DNA polymerase III delta subunit